MEDRKNVDNKIDNIKTIWGIEDMELTAEAEVECRKIILGQTTVDEAVAKYIKENSVEK